jgi:hypothetical protein
MSYENLVSEFVADNVQNHGPHLRLHNPHFDERIKHPLANDRKMVDWLHDSTIKVFDVQFIGSHYSNLNWLVDEEDRIKKGRPTKVCPFDARLSRLGIKARFRLGNCALGYIPDLKGTTGYFSRQQIEYLRPKKILEYTTSGTKAVFTLGWPSLDFHLYGTGCAISKFADAVDVAPISLANGLLVIPLPHPGPQGIMNYLRWRKKADLREKADLSEKAQDVAFRQLVNKGLDHLRRYSGNGVTSGTSDIV